MVRGNTQVPECPEEVDRLAGGLQVLECPEEVGRLAGGLQVPECPEEVGRLTGQSLAGVKHVEEEGELAGQAGLTRAEVAQNNDSQFF